MHFSMSRIEIFLRKSKPFKNLVLRILYGECYKAKRIADTWNQIPSNIKHITPVHKFKKQLINWMNTQRLTETD